MSEQVSENVTRSKRGTTKVGVVVSDVCDQTVTIKVVTPSRHKKYQRIVRRTTRFMAHDPENRCKNGDMVEIRECRPISKRKTWRVLRIVRAAPVAGGGAAARGAQA
jgi:small subunit ribosomal protein S17